MPLWGGLGLGMGGGGGRFGFSPQSLSGLTLWLPFGAGISNADILAGTVSQWSDVSGSGNNQVQATGVNRPAYSANGGPSGIPCITSTGTQWLASTAATVASARNWTAFVVHKSTDNTITGRSFQSGSSFGTQNTTGTRELIVVSIADDQDSTWTANTWELWTIADNGTNQSMRVNGSPVTISPNSATPNTPAAQTSVLAMTDGTLPFKGSVAGVIVYNRFLNVATEVAQVEAYIRGITKMW